MKVRKIGFVALAFLACAVVVAQDAAPGAVKRPQRRRRPAVASGGLLVKEAGGPVLQIVNAQSRVAQDVFVHTAFDFTTSLVLPWKAVQVASSADAQAVARAALAGGAAGVVVVVDSPSLPAILVAPEEGWSSVNVAKLAEGEPAAPVFAARLRKELWRAAAWAVGGGNSMNLPCLLRGVSTMKELDAIPLLQPGPEPNNKIIDEAHRRGVSSVRLASYRQACREGWAPAPTNDVQRAIFEQVKADKERGPSNPITIPPPKK